MQIIIDFIKNNKKAVIAVAIAVALLGAFGVGYVKGCFAQKEKIEEIKVVEEAKK